MPKHAKKPASYKRASSKLQKLKAPKRLTLKTPSETFESTSFARWLSRQPDLLYSKIPIGDNTLDDVEGAKLRSMGVRRGVPDFLIVSKLTGAILFIEMKRRKGGVTSSFQKEWLRALYRNARLARGKAEAVQFTKDFFEMH